MMVSYHLYVCNVATYKLLVLNNVFYKCDWLWEKPPVMYKDNYLEKRN